MLRREPKVLFIVTEDWYFWSHRLALAQAARDAGFKVAVATSPGQLSEAIRGEGYGYFPLRLKRNGKNPFGELLSVAELILLYRRFRPDLVHHVALKPVIYGSMAAIVARVPAIVNAVAGLGHTFAGQSAHKRTLQSLLTIACRTAFSRRNTATIFQNPDDLRLFAQRGLAKENRYALIRGAGVDTSRFRPMPEPQGRVTILLPSRMLWDKGVGQLVDAARILKNLQPNFRVLLAGRLDPCSAASIPEWQIREWEKENLVEWLGNMDVSEMPGLYARSHIVCLPSSYGEGIPLALIEAASCGRPIVTTNIPGCREIVRHNHNGILVPPRDTATLVQALHVLMSNPGMRRDMGQKGRQTVLEGFTQELVVSQTLEVYNKLLC